ncbi:MAG: hypothetical protein EOO65_04115 [Methanosarcinales archaeon]|nr:MAG: hypothetical protein EOO65_04115 [Methanosarcinales archaeon]
MHQVEHQAVLRRQRGAHARPLWLALRCVRYARTRTRPYLVAHGTGRLVSARAGSHVARIVRPRTSLAVRAADDPDADTWRKRAIQVKFEIPYFTVSGIQVRYLKILEKSGYQALPWVRYITQNGDYQLRMA